ncbi:hypothetical protein [Argonema galeatum]|uniref:hypothetical protein n=1 Tax=Argonema galeatum TaxID=2942762 RepID=UPI002011AD8D|nr:hypothetical protein [Argonema galeatum]MCL1463903.1 hypothetical protein [Argonema galeatum A003/A1]
MSNTQENNSELIPQRGDSQTPKVNEIISELDRAMERYTKALSAIETANPKPSQQEILEVLVARDTVSATLSQNQNHSSETLVTLINLDTRLRQQADPMAAIGKLEEWRSSLYPPETAWWWFFQRHHKHLSVWEKYDWLWDTITVGCLLLTSSFMSSLFH